MKEYEITNEDKILGKVQIYNELNKTNTIIKSLINSKYKVLDSKKNQQNYIVKLHVTNMDDVIKILEKYTDNNELEKNLEYIKKLNNIKIIKKPINIDFVIPESYLSIFNIDKDNIDLKSLLESKIYFIKSTNKVNIDTLITKINNFLESNEFKFLLDTEKNTEFNKFIEETNKIINNIEKNTIYKYGRDYIRAIRILND